ncbi:F420H(2):quinone oxidoreductase [Stenotrophomonas sp. Betaine-02u-21]|uniref:BLUF domain-containing protein n=1 Tax=unclassified Stenotrophomonas TaxID=196198 RepID=UPI000C32BE45|nr:MULTISPECIES: BLUF domain-containing protein [unclassified Stenotrophomonas]PKH70330.1 F420H(2):quinone oxidoreductase [Stenotrophomonas sp. Betaine-02u-23]PKH72258.1 F420H(2):quinone oxidoreductase [Stenotrophomonas sp. Betaine-02u-21]PKH96068.1 F420H(2):quinone oxidoreductase [Stenotrophomonas sp. Bg11-02]
MPIQAIAYTSEAVPGLGLDAVDDLTRKAAEFNKQAGVTGLLLFDGARFLQYLEGPEDGIAVVYSRVQNSRSHTGMVELGRARTGHRHFPYWAMRMLPSEPAELRGAVGKDWSRFVVRQVAPTGDELFGLEDLTRIAVPHLGHAATGDPRP